MGPRVQTKYDVNSPTCIVCGGMTRPYFTKDFGGVCDLQKVRYRQCVTCGFSFSETHYALSDDDWGELNERYHLSFFGQDECEDDPRWFERLTQQSEVLLHLQSKAIFPTDLPYYDYGCGDGKLSDMLASNRMLVRKYDKFLGGGHSGYLTDKEVRSGNFGLVVNTSVMEHVRDLQTLDDIANSVHPARGVLAMHTWVGKVVPRDDKWFYLLPVHISFFTNKAMGILLSRWGFVASVYVVAPRMWFLFRENSLAQKAYEGLAAVRDDVFHKAGFVDYWQ
jgi:hypothetical protein